MGSISIVSLCFSGIMMLVGVVTFVTTQVRTDRKKIIDDTNEFASIRESLLKVNMKLDQVCATTNETRADIKAMDKKLAEHSETIVILKRDLETAFLRLDELRESKADKFGG